MIGFDAEQLPFRALRVLHDGDQPVVGSVQLDDAADTAEPVAARVTP